MLCFWCWAGRNALDIDLIKCIGHKLEQYNVAVHISWLFWCKLECFGQEVKKRNQILLYVLKDDFVKGEGDVEEIADPAKVAGYLMYSWTSLAASISKLAGYFLTSDSGHIHVSSLHHDLSISVRFSLQPNKSGVQSGKPTFHQATGAQLVWGILTDSFHVNWKTDFCSKWQSSIN